MRSIPGSPLTIYANDNGQLQVSFNGSPTGEFFPPTLAPANAGLNVAVAAQRRPTAFTVFGFLGCAVHVGPPLRRVTGDGSAANPWVLTTNYRGRHSHANQDVVTRRDGHLRQRDDGRRLQYAVVNLSDGAALNGRLYEAAEPLRRRRRHGVRLPRSRSAPRGRRRSTQAAGRLGAPRRADAAGRTTRRAGAADVFAVDRQRRAWPPRASTTRSTRRFVDNGVGAQWDFPTVTTGPDHGPDRHDRSGASSASSPLQLAAASRVTAPRARSRR